MVDTNGKGIKDLRFLRQNIRLFAVLSGLWTVHCSSFMVDKVGERRQTAERKDRLSVEKGQNDHMSDRVMCYVLDHLRGVDFAD